VACPGFVKNPRSAIVDKPPLAVFLLFKEDAVLENDGSKPFESFLCQERLTLVFRFVLMQGEAMGESGKRGMWT
jgi:hypothetical protein